MEVLKFGGTSVGSADRMKQVAKLIQSDQPRIVVLSAMSGTTNTLVEITKYLFNSNREGATEIIHSLEINYRGVVDSLYKNENIKKKAAAFVAEQFEALRVIANGPFSEAKEKEVLAMGEIISTNLFQFYLQANKIDAVLLSSLDFMSINDDDEPELFKIREKLNEELAKYPKSKLFIAQGYICRNPKGEVDNLKRGGSDYTASLIGAAVVASEIQIWTDIDGFHNNDPRFVDNTKPIAKLSFDEAAELAYFGAKILHPSTVLPAKLEDVPVRLKNTFNPDDPGTLITSKTDSLGFKAIAAKDGITAIKIKSGRMLLAFGFMRKVFEIFEKYRTSVDMVTTSEVAISVTIDNSTRLEEIVTELKQFGTVEVDRDQSIICVVGDFIAESKGYARQVFDALKTTPIRMISYGGSRHNVSVLVKESDKVNALKNLSATLFKQ